MADARVRRVYLTRKGTRITQKIRQLVDPIEAEMLAPVADADLDSAIRALGQVKGTLLELSDERAPAPSARRRKATSPK